jgi:protoporphyrinogen oxidase
LHQLFFYYPIEGGFEALVDAFASRVTGTIEKEWTVADVMRDGDMWRVTSTTGDVRTYDTLVNTLPIHELLKVWPGAPQEARDLTAKLRYNSLINVLVGVNEDRGYPYTALYLPDPEILFHRVSFPKAFSERCAPAGQTAFMAEVTSNAGDGIWELTDEQIIDRALRDLERIAILKRDTVNYTKVVRFTYGYPVYDLDYRANVTAMRESVEATGMHLLGRFAQFDYINSDVCIERALALAPKLAAAG